MSYFDDIFEDDGKDVDLFLITDMEDMPDEPIWNELKNRYLRKRLNKIDKMILTIINSILTQKRVYFLFAMSTLKTLLRKDKNSGKSRNSLQGPEYKSAMNRLLGKMIREVKPSTNKQGGIYEVIGPSTRKFIEDIIGLESIKKQKENTINFYDNFGKVTLKNTPGITLKVTDTLRYDTIINNNYKDSITNSCCSNEEKNFTEKNVRKLVEEINLDFYERTLKQRIFPTDTGTFYQTSFLTQSLPDKPNDLSEKYIDNLLKDRSKFDSIVFNIITNSLNKFTLSLSDNKKVKLKDKAQFCFKTLSSLGLPIPVESITYVISEHFYDLEKKPEIKRMINDTIKTVQELDRSSKKKAISIKVDS